MKKICTLMLLAAAACGTASAQYVSNGNFDGDWEDCHPWEKGNYLSNNVGVQPKGWRVSNVYNSIITLPLVAAKTDNNNGFAVKLTNQSTAGQNVPAYLELGTPWATAETKGTTVRNQDGGSFGGVSFAYKPDAVTVSYKRESTVNGDKLSVVAYLWKGTWSQADVPSNTATGIFSYGTATKVTMKDRDSNIMGKSHILGGTVTKSADAELIAALEEVNYDQNTEWKTLEIPFKYNNAEATPEKLNVIIANTDYFGGASQVVNKSTVTVDNVDVVYWNTLSSLKYDGTELLEGEETAYDMSSVAYDPAKLVATAKSQFGTASVSYDDATCVATITVTREHAEAKTYTIQFAAPKAKATMSVSAAAGWGTFCAPFAVTAPSGVTVSTIRSIGDNGQLTLLPVRNGAIPANTPVILQNKTATNVSATFEGDAVEGTPSKSYLTGVYVDTPAPRDSYVLQNQDGRVGFYLVDGSTTALPTVKANRCYLTLPAGSSARALFFNEDDFVTALNGAIITDEPEAAYDLQGRRVNAAGQKGMLIIGGRKVIK